MATKKKKSVTVSVDFTDEEAVLAEMARELNINDLQLVGARNDWGVAVYEFVIHGHRNGKQWDVVENEDQERELALAVVTQDLEQEPEIFNKDFIERHINTDRLRRDLESDVLSNNEETLRSGTVTLTSSGASTSSKASMHRKKTRMANDAIRRTRRSRSWLRSRPRSSSRIP